MRLFIGVLLSLCFLSIDCSAVWASEQKKPRTSRQIVSPRDVMSGSTKGATVVPAPFQVTSVQFNTVSINNQNHLVVAIVFNKNIDPTTVQQNVNIRLLKKNASHFWLDASTQNNTVNVRPNFITWVSGVPLENGYYVMHLRGTIKSQDGLFLDCDGDGKGEGGNLPPYESQIHQETSALEKLQEILELIPGN